MILRWTFLSFSLFSFLGFLLQVQAKENAALMLPQFPKAISKQDQPWVGPYGHEKQLTYNGKKLVQFAKRHHLAITNTF